jgi:putative transposase
MPIGLVRYHHSGQAHFITFSSYRRRQYLLNDALRFEFIRSLEQTRITYRLCIYGFVLMPEHVHLLISEPERGLVSDAIHSLKLSVSKKASGLGAEKDGSRLWQVRYYDHNVRTDKKFIEKLRYIHRNPVKRGLCELPELWQWSSFNHYASGADCGVEVESEWTARRREKTVAAIPR